MNFILPGLFSYFVAWKLTGGLATIRQWLNQILDFKIGSTTDGYVGLAFAFFDRGRPSGFGTPAAIASFLF